MMRRPPVQAIVHLLRFKSSPDSEDPECICSLCRNNFQAVDADPEEERDDFPIRMGNEMKVGDARGANEGWEARFHKRCFEQLYVLKNEKIYLREEEIQIHWEWGDKNEVSSLR